MRKLIFMLFAMILFYGIFAGCSTDDETVLGNGNAAEARLSEIKQQFVAYGKQYGLENISFDDKQLKGHLHLTRGEIENEVIKLAMFLGKTNKEVGRVRRNSRKALPGDAEGGNGIQEPLFISGNFHETKNNDTLIIEYTIGFVASSFGYRCLRGVSASITKTHTIKEEAGIKVKIKCDPQISYIANISPNVSVTNFIAGFTDSPDTQVNYDISYCNCLIDCKNREVDYSNSFDGVKSGTATSRRNL